MIDLSSTAFVWIKALHIISVMAWMAGLLYLPRLFIYHCDAEPGSDKSETFKIMERRLLRAIMNPAMVVSLIFGGLLLANLDIDSWTDGWLHSKLLCVLLLLGMHGMMNRWWRDFENDSNQRPAKFYRVMNEVPTALMIGIVIFAVVKPF
ncbi:MAG: TIGR00701 family protein [Rhodospirillaceae bacterium]|jgi:putative membrane protein|nr:TIGR00701 family protein [Rhodospirillaceae bacterium]